MAKPRIVIADDHALMADGIARLLQGTCEVVGTCSNGRQLVESAKRLQPDLIVLDVGMPELNGIDAARQINASFPATKLIFVTQHIDRHYFRAALQAGAKGYVAKQSAASELLVATERVLAGKRYVTPLLADALSELSTGRTGKNQDPYDDPLTPRQREVLQLVAEGKSAKEISVALRISVKTVEFHKNALMNELGLRTIAELTRYALSHGLLTA